MTLRNLIALLAGAAIALPLSAQTFVGSDNFDSGFNASNWDYVYRLNSATQGTLSFTNSRLDFEKAASGVGNQFRLWNSDGTNNPYVVTASYSTSWSMTMSVTNTLSGLSSGQFSTIGIQVFNDNNDYSALMLAATSTDFHIQAEGMGFTTVNTAVLDNTDVLLRLTWDASAQTLGAAYSLDGSTYNSVATFLPVSQWNNAGVGSVTSGFNFGVFGNSNTGAAITVGSVYADNFAVSAIPEPSTYAALAGLGALGLALWRRRAAKTVA